MQPQRYSNAPPHQQGLLNSSHNSSGAAAAAAAASSQRRTVRRQLIPHSTTVSSFADPATNTKHTRHRHEWDCPASGLRVAVAAISRPADEATRGILAAASLIGLGSGADAVPASVGGRAVGSVLPAASGSGSPTGASSSSSVGTAALTTLASMLSAAGLERAHSALSAGERQHLCAEGLRAASDGSSGTNNSSSLSPSSLSEFREFVRHAFYNNRLSVASAVCEALLLGHDVEVRCPLSVPSLSTPSFDSSIDDGEDGKCSNAPLISMARDVVTAGLPSMLQPIVRRDGGGGEAGAVSAPQAEANSTVVPCPSSAAAPTTLPSAAYPLPTVEVEVVQQAATKVEVTASTSAAAEEEPHVGDADDDDDLFFPSSTPAAAATPAVDNTTAIAQSSAGDADANAAADDDDDLFFPSSSDAAPPPEQPAPSAASPPPKAGESAQAVHDQTTAAAATTAAVIPTLSSHLSGRPIRLHHALSLLPQLYVATLWPFVLHIAAQPVLDFRQGPMGIVVGASQQQVAELCAVLSPLAAQLELVVHNSFGPPPPMPETRRADIVVGTASRLCGGIVPTNNKKRSAAKSDVSNNAEQNAALEAAAAARYWPNTCAFAEQCPPAATSIGALNPLTGAPVTQAEAVQQAASFHYYSLQHVSQMVIFTDDAADQPYGEEEESEGIEGKGPRGGHYTLERLALERLLGTTGAAGATPIGVPESSDAAPFHFRGVNRGILPTCQIAVVRNTLTSSSLSSSLLGLHYRKAEVAQIFHDSAHALHRQAMAGAGGGGSSVDTYASFAPLLITLEQSRSGCSPSKMPAVGLKRPRSASDREAERPSPVPPSNTHGCVLRLDVRGVSTPMRFAQIGGGLLLAVDGDDADAKGDGKGEEVGGAHPIIATVEAALAAFLSERGVLFDDASLRTEVVFAMAQPNTPSTSSVDLRCSVAITTPSKALGSSSSSDASLSLPRGVDLAALCAAFDGSVLDGVRPIVTEATLTTLVKKRPADVATESSASGAGESSSACPHAFPFGGESPARKGRWAVLKPPTPTPQQADAGAGGVVVRPLFPFIAPLSAPLHLFEQRRPIVLFHRLLPRLRIEIEVERSEATGNSGAPCIDEAAALAMVQRHLWDITSRLVLCSASPLTAAPLLHHASSSAQAAAAPPPSLRPIGDVDSVAHVLLKVVRQAVADAAGSAIGGRNDCARAGGDLSSVPFSSEASLVVRLERMREEEENRGDDGEGTTYIFSAEVALAVEAPTWQQATAIAAYANGSPVPNGPTDGAARTYHSLSAQMGFAEGRAMHFYNLEIPTASLHLGTDGGPDARGGKGGGELCRYSLVIGPSDAAKWRAEQSMGIGCSPLLMC